MIEVATADVGIAMGAMGAMGADVAIETADVALMGEDLRHLPQALEQARRTRRIMLQNLGLSGAIQLTLVSLAAAGVLGLATVVLAHELAEVLPRQRCACRPPPDCSTAGDHRNGCGRAGREAAPGAVQR